MPDLIVNLQSGSLPSALSRAKRLTLEVADAPAAEAVKLLMPRVMDSFQLYLRWTSPTTFRDRPGCSG